MSAPVAAVDDLSRIVAAENLVTDPDVIGRGLRDNSGLSPVLKQYINAIADTAAARSMSPLWSRPPLSGSWARAFRCSTEVGPRS